MGIKNYFALTSRERNGLSALLFLATLFIVGDYMFRKYYRSPGVDLSELQARVDSFYAAGFEEEYMEKTIDVAKSNDVLVVKPDATISKEHKRSERPLLHIEINTASVEDLVQIRGIGEFYAKQIVELREKFGGIKDLSMLNELYGMDAERLALWKKELYVDPQKLYDKVLLNTADSVELCAIPCIKDYDARRIIRYRERLGGFYSSKQLLEVYGISQEKYDEIVLRTSLDSIPLKMIDINNIGFKELMKHPYIDGYENTKAIFRYLDLCPIEDWKAFCKIPNLKIENLESLKHYVVFNKPKAQTKE